MWKEQKANRFNNILEKSRNKSIKHQQICKNEFNSMYHSTSTPQAYNLDTPAIGTKGCKVRIKPKKARVVAASVVVFSCLMEPSEMMQRMEIYARDISTGKELAAWD